MARARNIERQSAALRSQGLEQVTITTFLDGIARRAESNDPRGPAARVFLTVLALMGFGLLVQASHAATAMTAEGFRSQLLTEVVMRVGGIATMLFAFQLGPKGIRRFLPFAMVVVGVLLVAVFIPGVGSPRNGSNRWVELLGVSFQPSELARIVLVVWIADRCVRLGHRVYDWRRGVMPMLAVVFAYFSLVLIETDLGGSMLLLICALSTMWVGGARALPMAASLVAAGGGAITALTLLVPYVRNRVAMWFGTVSNNQVDSTMGALESGGLIGAGMGRGALRTSGVPHLQSDYAFAQIGEEFGYLGLLIVLGLVIALLWNGLRLVLSLRDRFEALAVFGLLISVGLQAMLHMQVVAGLAPPKGTTLPFISDGGSSLLVSSLAVGMALGPARRRAQELNSCNP